MSLEDGGRGHTNGDARKRKRGYRAVLYGHHRDVVWHLPSDIISHSLREVSVPNAFPLTLRVKVSRCVA